MDMSVYDGVYYHLNWNWNFVGQIALPRGFLVIALARFHRAGNDIGMQGLLRAGIVSKAVWNE